MNTEKLLNKGSIMIQTILAFFGYAKIPFGHAKIPLEVVQFSILQESLWERLIKLRPDAPIASFFRTGLRGQKVLTEFLRSGKKLN